MPEVKTGVIINGVEGLKHIVVLTDENELIYFASSVYKFTPWNQNFYDDAARAVARQEASNA